MNFYAVLGLPSPTPNTPPPSPQILKDAYRRALLIYHPDKSTTYAQDKERPTVDEIVLAYETLSSPLLRASHDRELLFRKAQDVPGREHDHASHPGLETEDLDDLEYDEAVTVWYRSCRCGQERGYILGEMQLEKAADAGQDEVFIGCSGCSLWLKVSFAIAEGDKEPKDPQPGGQVADDKDAY